MSAAFKDRADLEALLAGHLGGDDPVFGVRFRGSIRDFVDPERLRMLVPAGSGDGCTIVYGCGASLAVPEGFLAYAEVPKNEVQFRSRAGVPINLGVDEALPPKPAYKRSYFVDWPALNAHRRLIRERIGLFIDTQRPEDPTWIRGDDWRRATADVASHAFRVRPWFEPGPWGGQWCRRHIAALPPAPNYAWSFELIAPENGVLFADASHTLECSFDWFMMAHGPSILGPRGAWFGEEFPIRFDFLDTVEGGNLSVQVHPAPAYIREQFGERFTQDETYYILDAAPGACVNLGFQEGVEAGAFRAALEASEQSATPLDAERWVQSLPARRHDLFLIPHGTVHGAGIGNLVLEISATPYIFTFKLYDWLRPDLDGKPRPLNVARGMANLDFNRSGSRVEQELVSRPVVTGQGPGWLTEALPTHPDHFFEIHRCRIQGEVLVPGADSVQVLNLVEGVQVEILTGGRTRRLSFAETCVVPACAGAFRIRNMGGGEAVVVLARIKERLPGWMHA